MKVSCFLALSLALPLASRVAAQNTAAQNAPGGEGAALPSSPPTSVPNAAPRVVEIERGALSTLPALLSRIGNSGAISLRVSEADFGADANAQSALLSWVRNGGTVFLHTGAARAFGFQTVAARLGSNALAGQLYGRARAALPFGAHPLLLDDGKPKTRRTPGADPTLFPGVNVVFYEMQEGDHLVESHPAGTPLLEASDLAGNGQNTLYAAAMAPFGRGFAVFTPDFIDQNRGDGALFARNLLNLVSSAASVRAGTNLVGVPASAIENGGASPATLQKALAMAGAFSASSPALPAFGTESVTPGAAPSTPRGETPMTPAMGTPEAAPDNNAAPVNLASNAAPPARAGAVVAGAVVLLSRAEAGSAARLIAAGGDRAAAAINLLRARLFLGRGEGENAARALQASADLAPGNPEIALWRGILQVGAAQNLNQPSPSRARLVQNAARDFAQAASAASSLPGAKVAQSADMAGMESALGGANLGGVSLVALRSWSVKLGQIAQVFALEPPLVEQYGSGNGAITVRAVAGDTSLRLVVPGAKALANARTFGWHGDNEEILLFPTPQSYGAYRRALGLSSPTVPLPSGALGDVVGQRISMIALPSVPAVRRNPVNGKVTILGTRNGAANLLARLHSSVLLGAYDESDRSPAWLQLGLENLVNIAVVGDTEGIGNNQILEQTARAGGLLTPAQFRASLTNARPEQLAIVQAQSASLMAFFYRAYGAGAVTETVQRLGLGQSIDQALEATTEGDQIALFQSWRNAQFGGRIFPNRG